MWLAHALTLSRIPLAIAFWITYGDLAWSIAIVAIAALTDAIDGSVARLAGKPSGERSTGDWLDPLADKLFVVIVLAAVFVHQRPPLFVVALIVAREVVLVPLAIAYRVVLLSRSGVARRSLRAAPIGKAATIAQFVAIAALVVGSPHVAALAVVAAALGLAAVAHYVSRVVAPA